MAGEHAVSVWFFIGLLLTAYGVLIVGAGIYHLFVPPQIQVVLGHLHAELWWGAVLLVMGLFYVYHFFPKRRRN